ncbi:penicillin-binding protein 1C [Vibrio ezurae]|uniref:peptidoglycan glycosyltransferase n=3 Tax=Vibrio ezurae TaxID=252583 RepID=U3CNR1_9VIBR|nr:transglycosylase domain-containing protein [Vibrio ezurae]GAD79763.1 putative penicillin-binding protein 1 [Vibrio ezurae NBRC 102218]
MSTPVKRWVATVALAIVALIIGLALAWKVLNWAFPLPSATPKSVAFNVLSAEGDTLRQFADDTGTFRIPVTVGEVSPLYLKSLLAYEDSRFYSHIGVDIPALFRALYQRIRYGKIVSGGSTLTMQVARIIYPIDRSYGGKLIQILRALQLEAHYSKQQILNLYLTHVPMGGNIEGVEAASQRYFGKSSKNLNISEAALLTVIPQRPSVYRPDRHPKNAQRARNKVLRRLIANDMLSEQEYQLLSKEAVVAGREPIKRKVPLLARELRKHQLAHFKQINDNLIQGHTPKAIQGQAPNSSSAEAFKAANSQQEIQGHTPNLIQGQALNSSSAEAFKAANSQQEIQGHTPHLIQGQALNSSSAEAFKAANSQQGIQGHTPHLIQGQALNSSSVKTFIKSELQQNVDAIVKQRFTALSNDLSVAVMVVENKTGAVLAYKGSLDMDNARSYGHVDMTKAIRSPGSTLKPFVYAQAMEQGLIHSQSLLMDIPMQFGTYKPQNFDKHFQGRVSATEALQRSKNLSAVYLLNEIQVPKFVKRMQILGSSLRLPDMNLTVVLGGGGSTLRELVMYYTALSRQGVAIKPRLGQFDKIEQAQLITPESAWITRTILQDIRSPDRPRAKFGRKIGWKTGTSFGFRDAWAIGTSNDYTVGVWMGRPDGSPYVGQTGATMAAPILFDVFDLLPKDVTVVEKPKAVEQVSICWPSGLAAEMVSKANCQQKRLAWTIDGVTPRTLRRDKRLSVANNWPQELLSWEKVHSKSKRFIDIIQPEDGSHIYPYAGQILSLKASSPDVRWYLDGNVSANQIDAHSLSGKHEIKACNNNTCSSVSITVH